MLTHLPASQNPSLLQRTARGILVGFCAMLAVGVLGAVTARAVDAGNGPATNHEAAGPVVMATDAKLVTAGSELMTDLRVTREAESVTAQPASATLPPAGVRRSHVEFFEVTAYCPCPKCCGSAAKGITASGKPVSYNGGRFVAADTRLLKFGTRIIVPGYNNGQPVEVTDTGSAIKGHRLDVFYPDHETAKQWGRRWIAVTVIDE